MTVAIETIPIAIEKENKLLTEIQTPQQLRELEIDQLPQLAEELRECLLKNINQSGGHFAANLGTVELAIAVHYVFDTPNDRLVWDVGHQTYPHKILTGRKKQMTTIRQKDGLAPFLTREESEYDSFGVGHSSTSISAALGMNIGSQLAQKQRHCIAIIGDGAMTAGMAFEALNHTSETNANLLVILNDNDMSISENVGGLSRYFARILASKWYLDFREGSKKLFDKIPGDIYSIMRRTEEHVKGMVVPGTLFEELGFNYVGPVDGHNVIQLVKTLRNLKTSSGPQFLHLITKKGKGFTQAEEDPIGYHAVKPGFLDKKETLAPSKPKPSKPTYSNVFGDWLCDMAAKHKEMIAITPAMREGSGMVRFAEEYPDRYLDVGIAEQHSVTLAAGIACEGQKAIVAIYSTFLQRAYDQLIHDVALQNLPVLFAIDRAGIAGADGPTHHGTYDINFLRCIPNMVIMTPADENECRQMLYTGYKHNGPASVRYPRGTGPGVKIDKKMNALPIGKGETSREGQHIALLAFGPMLEPALEAGEKHDTTVVNMRFVKPLDEQLINDIANTHSVIITIEDGAKMGGAGSAVNEYLITQQYQGQIINLGIPDQFITHGTREELLTSIGLDTKGINKAIQQATKK